MLKMIGTLTLALGVLTSSGALAQNWGGHSRCRDEQLCARISALAKQVEELKKQAAADAQKLAQVEDQNKQQLIELNNKLGGMKPTPAYIAVPIETRLSFPTSVTPNQKTPEQAARETCRSLGYVDGYISETKEERTDGNVFSPPAKSNVVTKVICVAQVKP